MNTLDLRNDGFRKWNDFSLDAENTLLANLPGGKGVYIIRSKISVPRLRGKSDILYVGSSIGQSGLRHRIRLYFHPGPTQTTSKRIKRYLETMPNMEIAFVIKEESEARRFEHKLLEQYDNDHGELPPFNRSG